MTEISLLNDDYVWEVRGIGHTDRQVCAGVSAIMMAFAGVVHNCESLYIKHNDVVLEDGNYYIQIQKPDMSTTNGKRLARKIDNYFRMLSIGLLQIEKKYPKYLDIKLET